MIEFKVVGECVPKGRPRFRSVGKFVQTYNTEETVNYENLVKISFMNSGCEKIVGKVPISVTIVIHKLVPKSFSKKKTLEALEGKLKPVTKPDLDNCAKSILDSLNKVAFDDDGQVAYLQIYKIYDNEEYTFVRIEE